MHIDDVFPGTSLESFLREKLAQLIARENGIAGAAPLDSLQRCTLADEQALLHFLKCRLDYLGRRLRAN